MPPLKSAKKLQPQIVLDDIFKNKSNIGRRKNAVTIVGPPWSRRFSADSNKRSSNIPQRAAINLRSRGRPEVIVINDDNDVSKKRKSIATKDYSEAARTRGLPLGLKRKLDDTLQTPEMKYENSSENDDKNNISKSFVESESTEIIAAKSRGSTPKNNKKLAKSSQSTIDDLENHRASGVKTSSIQSTSAVKKIAVASKKRGRPVGSKNNKIDKANCSCFDVIIIDDKAKVPKLEEPCESKETISAGGSESRDRLSQNDVENVLNAILKEKHNILQPNGELVSERHRIWQLIRHELEYQVTAQTLRRIARSEDVYKLLRTHELKDEPVNIAEVAEVAVIDESTSDEISTRFEHVLEKLCETIDSLAKAIKDHGKTFYQRDNSAQKRQ